MDIRENNARFRWEHLRDSVPSLLPWDGMAPAQKEHLVRALDPKWIRASSVWEQIRILFPQQVQHWSHLTHAEQDAFAGALEALSN